MVLNANIHIITAMRGAPIGPMTDESAFCVSSTPLLCVTSTGLHSMTKAVHEHTISVSEKTPSACISPCFTGCATLAVAAALGAEPSPASLLNNPRFMPIMTIVPNVAPVTCLMPKASSMMRLKTEGRRLMLAMTTYRERARYKTAMKGTTSADTFATRCMPPNMIAIVSMQSSAPIYSVGMLNACFHASAMVLLCMALLAKPKVSIMSRLKTMPIHLFFSPYRM